MRHGSLSNVLSSEEQDVNDVWSWYEFQRTLIGEEKSRVLDSLSLGAASPAPRYFGKSREELEDDFAHQVLELGRLAMFGLLSCTEAAFRVDFVQRVRNKRKDDLSRAFRDAFKERHGSLKKIRLSEDIFDAWKRHRPETKRAVGYFNSAPRLRDWLAHGRYWKPTLATEYDPVDVFEVCRDVLTASGLLPTEKPGA